MPHLPRPQSSTNDQDHEEPSHANESKSKTNHNTINGKRMPSAGRIMGQSDSKKAIGNNTEINSRKSTAVSSTSRIGSSGNLNMTQKRVSYAVSGIGNDSVVDKPLYELSISSKNKKPPHKLKPLNSAKLSTSQIDNKALSILEIENAYQREMMNDIDSDINQYLDANQIFKEMKNAFNETPLSRDDQLISSTQSKKTKLGKTMASLDPILEEAGALVQYQPNLTLAEQRAKKNEALKNKVKKITGQPIVPALTAGPSSDIDAETFITGTKIAQQPSEDDHIIQEYESQQRKKKKYYKYEEDELLDDLDEHERDMNEMLKNLTEIEDMMKGTDLKSIQQMMDVTKETMNQHFQAYDKFKDNLTQVSTQADDAIKILTFYDDEPKSNKEEKKNNRQLERVFEGDEDQYAQDLKNKKPPLEKQKTGIVNQLLNMNQSMREFATDIESRLDRAYKTGATKKFGYDSITNTAQEESAVTVDTQDRGENRKLKKLQSQAKQFIDQNSAAAILRSTSAATSSGTSYSKAGRKSSQVRNPSSTQASTDTTRFQRKGSFTKNKNINEDINI